MYMTEREKLEVEFYDEGRNIVSNSNLSIKQRKLIVTRFVGYLLILYIEIVRYLKALFELGLNVYCYTVLFTEVLY